jgi:hypothetical protein
MGNDSLLPELLITTVLDSEIRIFSSVLLASYLNASPSLNIFPPAS